MDAVFGSLALETHRKPWLLDLFCGAGGAARGYMDAGFYVVGVDIAKQPHYCGDRFIQGDALEYAARHGYEFDAIHASPPCQRYTSLRRMKHIAESTMSYADLIEPARRLLQSLGVPYVIENVKGAPLLNPVELCGSMFDLKVYRHRLFESSVMLFQPTHTPHNDKTPPSGRGASPKGFIAVSGNGGLGIANGFEYAKTAMGINFEISRRELSEAIPPAYTRYIGEQLIKYVA